jgi:transposase
MRTAIPPISEDVDHLKQLLRQEHDGRKKPRVQMLYLLRSGQAPTRQDVARLLGFHRNTVGHWLARYAAGGLDVLLELYVPAGKRRSLSPDVLASIEQAFHRPEGFASYDALRQWVQRTHGERSSTRRSTLSCARASIGSSKWPGRVTQKNPEAIPMVQASCHEHLRQLIPAANTPPIRVFSRDASRFSLVIVRRRRLTAYRVQPIGPVQHVFPWFYVYGAVEPTTGNRYFLELPHLDAESFQLFIDMFAQAYPDSLNLLLLDNSGAHTAQRLTIPGNVRLVFLPPCCPELNPIEQVRRDLKDALAWLQFTNLDAQQDYVGDLLQAYEASTLQSLTSYPHLVEAIHALQT